MGGRTRTARSVAVLALLFASGCTKERDTPLPPAATKTWNKPPIGPPLRVEQKCGFVLAAVGANPGESVYVPRSRNTYDSIGGATADSQGTAQLRLPREAFQAPVTTLEFVFGSGDDQRRLTTRLVLRPDPSVHLLNTRKHDPPEVGTTRWRDGCGNQGTGGQRRMRSQRSVEEPEPYEFEFTVTGAKRARATGGRVALWEPEVAVDLVQVLGFSPDWWPALSTTSLETPVRETVRVEGEKNSWVELEALLDPSAKPSPELSQRLGRVLTRYADVESSPVGNAPTFSRGARAHPTLLFEGRPGEGQWPVAVRGEPRLRAAFLADKPVQDVEVVAYYEKRRRFTSRCPAPTESGDWEESDGPLPSDYLHAYYAAARGAPRYTVRIREAKSGKLIAQRAFVGGPASCDGPDDADKKVDAKALKWLEQWTGTAPALFGPSIPPATEPP